mmetsp:Transcript_12949/g.37561  ORF Transcript_12949/g.37561 Transcript_12949/m.37561 type:complete len:113 (+) Transcript_12949:1-339(+)
MHDACWTPSPNFELLQLLLEEAPHQLVMKDVRGYTPFDYVRKSDWEIWMEFLEERRDMLQPKKMKTAATSTTSLKVDDDVIVVANDIKVEPAAGGNTVTPSTPQPTATMIKQ